MPFPQLWPPFGRNSGVLWVYLSNTIAREEHAGESEINAASSITALVKSPKFDLTVARSKQGCIEWMEATVLLTI
jgi:Purine nucleoside permease (NUP)